MQCNGYAWPITFLTKADEQLDILVGVEAVLEYYGPVLILVQHCLYQIIEYPVEIIYTRVITAKITPPRIRNARIISGM